MMINVLVTGATGFIGYEVADLLVTQGFKPRLMVRRPDRGFLLGKFKTEIVQGDLESKSSLKKALSGIDTVVHLAARATFEKYSLIKSTIVDGSSTLMNAAIGAGVKNFVYTSSLLVYESQQEAITSSTPVNPQIDYGKAKIEAETLLSGLADRNGINLAIMRLPHVYGARDLLFGQIRNRRLIRPGMDNNLFSHMHVKDAAGILIRVAQKGWTGTTPLSDELPTAWNTFFLVIKEYFPRLRYVSLPKWFALLGSFLLKPTHLFRSAPNMATPDTVKSWNFNLAVDSKPFLKEIEFTLTYPNIYKGIPAVLDDYVAYRWLHPVKDSKDL
jgi:nucleoside-diphosphate-sugar epimerase